MSSCVTAAHYFLGSATPNGFVGTTTALYQSDWQVYILKSGAGTGKSTLLRRLYDQKSAESNTAEVFCCSADPASLDAVRFPDRRLLVIDGTAPHSIEPTYWHAVEHLVPLCACMRQPLPTTEVVTLTDQKHALQQRSAEYLRAAASLLAENRRLQAETLDDTKITRLARRLAVSEWRHNKGTPRACETRFLSAFTPQGLQTRYDTLQALCPRIYAIQDEHGEAATRLLSVLQQLAEQDGIPCLSCPSPLFPDDGPLHLLFPEIGLAFTTSNTFHPVDFPIFRRIHASRFAKSDDLQAHRAALSFRRRAAAELLQEAASFASQAKAAHDALESVNAAAMDWKRYERLTTELLETL